MKVRKPHFFYCEIYMVNIYFYQGIPAKEVVASMKKHLRMNYDAEKLLPIAGRSMSYNDGEFVIYMKFKSKKHISTLAHECLHVTNMILERAGVRVDLDNDEAQAYLLGWLMKKLSGVK
jgi:hypothetical protein